MFKLIKEALFLTETRRIVKLLKAGYILQCDVNDTLENRLDTQMEALAHLSLRIVELEKAKKPKTKKNETRTQRAKKRISANNNAGRKALPRRK